MDLLTVSSLYHAGGAPLPMWLVWLGSALLLAIALQWRLGLFRRAPVRVVQQLLAAAGLLLAAWLVAVEVLVFDGRCPLCLAASAALALAFALGLRRADGKVFGAVLLLAAGGLGYLLPFGTIPKVSVLAEPAPQLGGPDRPQRGQGPLLVQEFADFQCGACARMDATVERFVERHEAEVRYVYRHLPLKSIHPWAERAALASECAARQGRFREAKRMMFERQEHLGSLLGEESRSPWPVPDEATFRACLETGATGEVVQQDVAEARRLRLRSTPSLLIGQTLVVGTTSLSRLDAILDFARTQGPPTDQTAAGEVPSAGCTEELSADECTSQ
jgi:protein-disulfide isomerase